MIKLAKILQIDANHVTLKLEQQNQCSDCESRCSDGFLSFLFRENNDGVINVALGSHSTNDSHLLDSKKFFNQQHKKNDVIGIQFKESQLFKMALYLYGLPIILILLSLLMGYYGFQKYNMNSDLGGILGFAFGLVIAKFLIKLKHHKIMPKVSFFK